VPFLEHDLRRKLAAHAPKTLPRGESTKQAAVAAVLRWPGPEVLVIRRTERPSDRWSGHLAFPGGGFEPGDADTLATAIRETREEVGLELRPGDAIGRLDDIQAISRALALDLVIVPHVFAVQGPVELQLGVGEVEEAIWAPLEPMVSGAIATTVPYQRDGLDIVLPGYRIGPHVLWGLTYRMLELLFDVARGGG
jgi:8-oxo-dGTP pyrophosphatase MutT (NUDIX family)